MKSLAKRRRLTKRQKQRRNRGLLGIFIVLLIFISGYIVGRRDITFTEIRERLDQATTTLEQQINNAGEAPESNEPVSKENTSQIHILDVGQGSSILLISRDGTSILVDTGRFNDPDKRIISYLDSHIGLGQDIDLLIFTHSDADHIGNGDLVLEYFDVQEVWMNGVDSTSREYSDLLDALLESDATYAEPKAGEVFNRGDFEIEVLHPAADSPQKDANDESIVTRISFDGISFMNSGDASIPRENEIVDRTGSLKSDMMMLGHHGSADSTGEKWIQAVNPKLAFYQAGANNPYGHPTAEALERLELADIPVYGTDDLGTISIYIGEDGQVNVETER